MGTVDGMLAAMRALLGTVEEPSGSNHNFLTQWYANLYNSSQNDYDPCPWCDIAVSYAASVSGNLDAIQGPHAWTVEHAKMFQNAGLWTYGTAGMRTGDIVFFDWKGGSSLSGIDHVGVCEAVNSTGYVTTIEGNTNDVCARRLRSPSLIVGYGRPTYDGVAIVLMVESLQVDGVCGPLTIKALQRALNRTDGFDLDVDGEFGPITKRALQRFLNRVDSAGLTVDGIVGTLTRKALQRHLGVTADGVWGPLTTKALQRRLNLGTL